ncbi:hypothetical protein AB9K26_07450 [Psychroserpens sp. XS_ASV72]|uniref:hypothetical protein n=1 Tax=Psychroserpens sp. XS_ASV72 TaxID=3241293 RepID=UPI00351489D0
MKKKKWFRTLQFLAAYLVAAWTFLQFIDWILNRYNISPYWVDVLLWFFVGIIPSLLIYLHNQERINKRILYLREKIIFPLNIILLALVLYFGFGNSDLGATTKNITFENSDGEVETKTITKEEFRVGFPIFDFKQEVKDSTTSWMQYGIGRILMEDLLQNKNLSPDFMRLTSTTDKIREASLFYDFYIDGRYKKTNDGFEITTYIRKASNGKILTEKTFRGANVLPLLDEISVFITSEAGFVEQNGLNYIDLPINEFMSNSLPALEAFVNGNYSKAYEIDKNFALAYLENAKRKSLYNHGKLETQDIIDKAFALKNKLPLQKQLEVFIQRNLAYNNYKEAEKQVNLQLEVDPSNDFYNRVLFSIYGDTKQIESYLKKSEELFEKDPKAENGMNLAIATLVNGDEEELLKALKPYEVISPEIKKLKLAPLILTGKIREAEKILEELKFGNYRNDRLQVYDTIIKRLKNNTPKIENLKQFEGKYISNTNEQVTEFWLEDNRLIRYVSHQRMQRMIPVGPNTIGGGYVGDQTWLLQLVKDTLGKPIGIKSDVYYWNGKNTGWLWKIDSHITKAEEAFDKGDYNTAKHYYEIALKENPNHEYINNILAHITYVSNNDKEHLLAQHKSFEGTYGPRKFWIENDKFYYKRKGENIDLPKVELLPISENRYMYLTRLGTIMQFEENDQQELASVPYSLSVDDMTWNRLDGDTNYFIKNN